MRRIRHLRGEPDDRGSVADVTRGADPEDVGMRGWLGVSLERDYWCLRGTDSPSQGSNRCPSNSRRHRCPTPG